MRPIPPKLREKLSESKFMKRCCIADHECRGRIEFHHNLTFAGRQVNEEFCILPLCTYHHSIEKRRDIKEKLNWVMLNRAETEQLEAYSKAVDYVSMRERLNKRYSQPQ